MRLFRGATCCVILLVLSAGLTAFSEEYTFQYQKIVDVEKPIDLELDLSRGNVVLFGEHSNRLVIEAVRRVRAAEPADAEAIADHIEIRVDTSHGNVKIRTNYLKLGTKNKSFWGRLLGSDSDHLGEVDFRIAVPAVNSIKIRS